MKKIILLFLIVAFSRFDIYAQRILLSQGFENGPYTADSIPLNWAKFKINSPAVCPPGAQADWRVRDSGVVFCGTNILPGFRTKAYNSRKSLSIPWTASAGAVTDDWVFTDSVRLTTGDSLKFWIQLGTWPDGQSTYYLDSLQVWVTTVQAPTGGINTKLGTITSLPQPVNVWQFKVFTLDQFNGQKVYVAFRYNMNTSVDGIMVNIDSIFIGNLSGPPVAIHNNNENLPKRFDLKQNYPNPFNPTTTIMYDVPRNEFVNITVYNSLGQEIAVLINEQKSAGFYNVSFDASNLPSGIYLYKMRSGDFVKTLKMSLVK